MFYLKRTIQLASLFAIPAACHPSHGHHSNTSSYVKSLPKNAPSLLTESMDWLDGYYDPSAGYLFDVSSTSALRHETRSSAWYAIGLLARNEGKDVEYAMDIITNVIAGQFKDPEDQWYVSRSWWQEPD